MSNAPVDLDPAEDMAARRLKSHDDLRRRTVAHMRAKTTDLADGPRRIDPAAYTDPDRAARERRELFCKRPILACLSGDMPNPGDKYLFDAAGPPVLITRNKAGEVRAFLNICTHRAARLVTECHSRGRMTCRFHAWTFDLDGKLIGQPGKEGFEGIEKDQLGLIPVPVAEWHGLIFVRATPDGDPIDVEDWLGDMASELAHLELEKARPVCSSEIPAAANWKYAFDTYGESYHFASLHPTTIGALAFSNIMTLEYRGRHTRLGFPRAEFADYGEKPESEWPGSDYGGLYMIFPNVVINVNSLPGGGQFYGISRVFPGETVDRSNTLMTTYRPGHAAVDFPEEKWRDMHGFIEQVVRTEDYSVSADGQRNLKWAPEGFRMVFGANEGVLQHNHAQIDEILESANER